jgi:hypothetical protein
LQPCPCIRSTTLVVVLHPSVGLVRALCRKRRMRKEGRHK